MVALVRWLRARPARLLPAQAIDASLVEAAARCVACGACDQAYRPWAAAPRDRFFGPMHFVLTTARGSEHFAALDAEVGALLRADLAALRRVCPVDVPFEALARAVRSRVPLAAPKPAQVRHDPG